MGRHGVNDGLDGDGHLDAVLSLDLLEEFIVYKKAKHNSHIKGPHALAQGSMDFTSPVESAIAHGAAYCARYASFRTEFVARTGPVGPVSDAC